MEVKFANSFSKSLKTLAWHHHPIYKFYEFFRYKIPMFFKNVWFFRKELWQFRPWDYTFNFNFWRSRTKDICQFKFKESGFNHGAPPNFIVKNSSSILVKNGIG